LVGSKKSLTAEQQMAKILKTPEKFDQCLKNEILREVCVLYRLRQIFVRFLGKMKRTNK